MPTIAVPCECVGDVGVSMELARRRYFQFGACVLVKARRDLHVFEGIKTRDAVVQI